MVTSTGSYAEYLRYGYFEFQIDEKGLRLQAYKQLHTAPGHGERLFVPFRDGTSGRDSYGAARYLDVMELAGDEYVLDFNLAYNPYCAYSENYVCPFPPAENALEVEIRAGERKFKD
jgi:uncharacterized protein (DUF1684 family)